MQTKILSTDFFDNFIVWVNFSIDTSPINKRYVGDFSKIISICFLSGLSLGQTLSRLDYLLECTQGTILYRWAKDLKIHFLIFFYKYEKNISLTDLCFITDVNYNDFIFKVRQLLLETDNLKQIYNNFSNKVKTLSLIDNYFLKKLPLETFWNITFQDLEVELPFIGSIKSNLAQVDLILSKDVILILKYMNSEFVGEQVNDRFFKLDAGRMPNIKLAGEALFLILIFFISSFAITNSNKYLEKKLTEKIKILEPQFSWLKKSLIFKNNNIIKYSRSNIVKPKEFNTLEKAKHLSLNIEQQHRWSEPESETILSSLESVPQNIDESNFEQSKYDEVRKRGYRDSRYGSTKVYRVIINSENLNHIGKKLKVLLSIYNTEKVGQVKPGINVPGGKYYNIYVPRKYLKEFLQKALDLGQSFLYESRTRTNRNPRGKNKVFIWAKSIRL